MITIRLFTITNDLPITKQMKGKIPQQTWSKETKRGHHGAMPFTFTVPGTFRMWSWPYFDSKDINLNAFKGKTRTLFDKNKKIPKHEIYNVYLQKSALRTMKSPENGLKLSTTGRLLTIVRLPITTENFCFDDYHRLLRFFSDYDSRID